MRWVVSCHPDVASWMVVVGGVSPPRCGLLDGAVVGGVSPPRCGLLDGAVVGGVSPPRCGLLDGGVAGGPGKQVIENQIT